MWTVTFCVPQIHHAGSGVGGKKELSQNRFIYKIWIMNLKVSPYIVYNPYFAAAPFVYVCISGAYRHVPAENGKYYVPLFRFIQVRHLTTISCAKWQNLHNAFPVYPDQEILHKPQDCRPIRRQRQGNGVWLPVALDLLSLIHRCLCLVACLI